ncbi:MAG: LruC domain-containing protein [Deltaproteobacteria bacterium]|nr:LruC domain-containing protein [Deltaproteobacteria bacterium]
MALRLAPLAVALWSFHASAQTLTLAEPEVSNPNGDSGLACDTYYYGGFTVQWTCDNCQVVLDGPYVVAQATYVDDGGQTQYLDVAGFNYGDGTQGELYITDPPNSGPHPHPITLNVQMLGVDGWFPATAPLTIGGFYDDDHLPAPPTITCQESFEQNVDECGNFTNQVYYPATVEHVCEYVPLDCSGIVDGVDSYTCTATDSHGQTSSCTTPVTFNRAPLRHRSAPTITGFSSNLPDGGFCDTAYESVISIRYDDVGCGVAPVNVSVSAITYKDRDGNDQNLSFYEWPSQDYYGNASHMNLALYLQTIQNAPAGTTQATIYVNFPDGTVALPYTLPTPEHCPCINEIISSSGQVLFEDLWPMRGADLDFNDQNFSFKFDLARDGNTGRWASLTASFKSLSLGATIDNGLYLHLPGVSPDQIQSVVRVSGDGTRTVCAPLAGMTGGCVPLVPGESEAVIPVSANTRELWANQSGYLDTDPSGATADSSPVSYIITFMNLPYGQPDSGKMPFDLFIAHSDDYGHQIHLSNYPGTDLMDTSLFGTGIDASDYGVQGGSVFFVDGDGLPFGLLVPSAIDWPTEKTEISNLYGGITDWAASGGSTNEGWYTEPSAGAGYNESPPLDWLAPQPAPTTDYTGCED